MINRDLEKQIIRVKDLSEKSLAQEREAKKLAVERVRLEAEIEQKNRELEEARKLQISMLPCTIPKLPKCDIGVYMQTATEVGGDYYDFSLCEDGTLTIAIGDATGHGLHAGIMVAATKSLFNALSHEPNPVHILSETSTALRAMGFKGMYMAMTVAKLKDRKIHLSAAGMPFTLLYRASTKCVHELILKGLPLGNPIDYPYQEETLDLKPDDSVLFMSDGFIELFNQHGEMLGNEIAKLSFGEAASGSPDEIIKHLVETGNHWSHGMNQQDDITFVVMKMKS
jgi:serine phosphatase RsbU (regulator of sigma subunit)